MDWDNYIDAVGIRFESFASSTNTEIRSCIVVRDFRVCAEFYGIVLIATCVCRYVDA